MNKSEIKLNRLCQSIARGEFSKIDGEFIVACLRYALDNFDGVPGGLRIWGVRFKREVDLDFYKKFKDEITKAFDDAYKNVESYDNFVKRAKEARRAHEVYNVYYDAAFNRFQVGKTGIYPLVKFDDENALRELYASGCGYGDKGVGIDLAQYS